MIDDHLIDHVRNYFNASFADLKKEWLTGNYERLLDCPSFKTCYTYRQALKTLINPIYSDSIELEEMLNEEIEFDKWRNK